MQLFYYRDGTEYRTLDLQCANCESTDLTMKIIDDYDAPVEVKLICRNFNCKHERTIIFEGELLN